MLVTRTESAIVVREVSSRFFVIAVLNKVDFERLAVMMQKH